MRYYSIVIGEGTSPLLPNMTNGLATSLGILQSPIIMPQRGRRNRRESYNHSRGMFNFRSPSVDPHASNLIPASISNVSDIIKFGETLSVPSSIMTIPPWSSLGYDSNGQLQNDPGALDIEFDIVLSPGGHLLSGHLKVWGIPQSVINQTSNFTRRSIQIYAGMWYGLPLANMQVPHRGKIADGMIFPCYGNWIGNELSIEFVINPGTGGLGGPTDTRNIKHDMPKGTSLSSAIQSALSTALPGYNIAVNIANIVLDHDDQGFYGSVEQYQNYVKSLSHSQLGSPETTGYQGVTMYASGNNIYITDGTIFGNNIQLAYADLIGQPTWSPMGGNVIQIKTVLRADITPANSNGNITVTLPPDLLVTTPQGAANLFLGGQLLTYQPGDKLNFQGQCTVISVRHVGHFRQPSGEAWVTIIDAIVPFSTGIGTTTYTQTGGLNTFQSGPPINFPGQP